jgi:hypothetical protein
MSRERVHRDAEALLHQLIPVRELPHGDREGEHRRPRFAPQSGHVGGGTVMQVPRDSLDRAGDGF